MRATARAVLLALILPVALPAAAAAQVIPPMPPPCPLPCPRPDGPVTVEEYRVEAVIDGQVATTRVTQVLRNDGGWLAEAEFIHPLPPGAAVTGLTLWIDGEPYPGEILHADEARRIYRDIVAAQRDPALLEFVDHGLVRVSVFPIPAGEIRRIEIEYTQVLATDQGLARYRHPLGTEWGRRNSPERISARIEIASPVPIGSVYSPTHQVSVQREDPRRVVVGYESGGDTTHQPLALYYGVGDGEIGLHLITFRDPGEGDPDGYFLLLASPGLTADPGRVAAKDVILVIDRSGSMEGEKYHQAREAAAYVLGNLNERDRFGVIAFSSGVDAYSGRLQPAAEEAEAVAWLNRLGPGGSTDIDRALREAFRIAEEERPTYVLFLTDGLPTEGEIETNRILDSAARNAGGNIRLFAFGVGHDVDTILLDGLADQHRGTSTYVVPGEAIDETVNALYRKLSNPVLTGVEIDFGDIAVSDLYPRTIPDLFSGEQLVLLGRYRDGGTADIELRGRFGDEERSLLYPDRRFEAHGGQPAVARLWATRKIGDLLRLARTGEPTRETIEQIVALSIRFGIVTPYTSYLVTDDQPLGAASRESMAKDAYDEAVTNPAPASGSAAVDAADAAGRLLGAESAHEPGEYRDRVIVAGSRTFLWVDGTWIDTAFDPETMGATAVPFLSPGYFALAEADTGLASALAVGERVIVVWRGAAYRVVDEGSPVEPFDPASIAALLEGGATEPGADGASGPQVGAPGDDGSDAVDGQVAATLPGEDPPTPWWLLLAGAATLSGGILTMAVLARRRH